jgi:hypothetical protein
MATPESTLSIGRDARDGRARNRQGRLDRMTRGLRHLDESLRTGALAVRRSPRGPTWNHHQPAALHSAGGGGPTARVDGLRRRLRHTGRDRCARLHPRPRSRSRPPGCPRISRGTGGCLSMDGPGASALPPGEIRSPKFTRSRQMNVAVTAGIDDLHVGGDRLSRGDPAGAAGVPAADVQGVNRRQTLPGPLPRSGQGLTPYVFSGASRQGDAHSRDRRRAGSPSPCPAR